MRPGLVEAGEQEAAQEVLALLGGEASVGRGVRHHLERLEVAGAAHVADDREVAQRLEPVAEAGFVGDDVVEHAFAVEHVEVGERDRAAHRMTTEREAVGERRLVLEERLGEEVAADHRAERRVPAGEALGAGDDVGEVVVALAAEHGAEATERADHLVGHEQHAVAVADLAHAREVALGRDEAPARVLHRLQEHRGDRLGPLEQDPFLDLVGDREHERLLVVAQRVATAVGVGDVRPRPGVSGSNGVRSAGTPVMARAPRVVPWYAVRRAITLWRWPWPMARKYWRASFHADSTASDPPVVKNTRLRSPGASSASRAASSIAGGCA